MTVTLQLSDEEQQKLAKRAAAAGKDVQAYLAALVEREISRPSLAEILSPIHEEFERSGMSEGELDQFLADEVRAMRVERSQRQVQQGSR